MASTVSADSSTAPAVSVIVPVLNDGAWLARRLAPGEVRAGSAEWIVVDGGSSDNSASIAMRGGARVLHAAKRQRAAQMNLGAHAARAPVLLFLHADTRLPDDWLRTLMTRLQAEPALVGGAFRRRFDRPSAWLRATCVMADWRGRCWGCFLGDQAMFVRAAVFSALGGFRDLDQCEDLDFSLRLARIGRTCLLGPAVLSSGRRFAARGPVRQTLADLMTACRFMLQPPGAMARRDVSAPLRVRGMATAKETVLII